MKKIISGLLVLMAALILCSVWANAAEKWKDLLPGNDFKKHWETTGNWSISSDGAVTLTPRPGEKGWERWSAYLWSKDQYQDFEIEFDYKVEPKGNSGFYFHVGDKNDPVKKGIEVQIYDSHGKHPDKKLTDHDSGGIIPGAPPSKNTAKPASEWNTFNVTSKGRNVIVKLNGEVVNQLSLDDPKLKDRPPAGYIGFQDHGMPLSLRKIRIRSL
jgi:hypothetical protein